MNIAFMVEWSRFAEKAEVDIYSMIDAIRLRPTHSNMMYPGIGVGGYCLTKDALDCQLVKQSNLQKRNNSIKVKKLLELMIKCLIMLTKYLNQAKIISKR